MRLAGGRRTEKSVEARALSSERTVAALAQAVLVVTSKYQRHRERREFSSEWVSRQHGANDMLTDAPMASSAYATSGS
jgi:hypothetical protein